MEKLEFAQKIKTCEQLALSCYMKRGYLGEAQPSLVLDASQIGHFHGIMWEPHILEDTDEGFLSNNSLAFFTHSSQLCLFQPYTNSLPPTESCFEYNSMDLEIVALSWALPFMGQSCQVAQHRFFKCKNKSSACLSWTKWSQDGGSPFPLSVTPVCIVIPLLTIGVFSQNYCFSWILIGDSHVCLY